MGDGSWHHVVLTVDERYVRLYIDGSLNEIIGAGHIWVTKVLQSDADLIIGGKNLKGYLDEMSFYNKLLTPSEIQDLYNSY